MTIGAVEFGLSIYSPLSSKQRVIWDLVRSGLSVKEIAGRLKTSRQYVHQVATVADAKVSEALLSVARSANLQVKMVDARSGVLLGYDPALASKTLVTYTKKYGVRIWHWYERIEEIKDPSYMYEVREYLLNEAKERGMTLSREEEKMHPAELARIVFEKLIAGLES